MLAEVDHDRDALVQVGGVLEVDQAVSVVGIDPEGLKETNGGAAD